MLEAAEVAEAEELEDEDEAEEELDAADELLAPLGGGGSFAAPLAGPGAAFPAGGEALFKLGRSRMGARFLMRRLRLPWSRR